jgi:hypothetical protein
LKGKRKSVSTHTQQEQLAAPNSPSRTSPTCHDLAQVRIRMWQYLVSGCFNAQ